MTKLYKKININKNFQLQTSNFQLPTPNSQLPTMKRNEFEIEICANSLQSVIEAEIGGADRVELCDNLLEGGTTPSIATIALAKEKTKIDIFPIIRPRGGDFLYSDIEFETMKLDINICRKYNVDGIVIGCLTANGEVDYDMCAYLIEEAKGLPVTFHRAFDMLKNPFDALKTLKKLGVSRILSSGQKNKAEQGMDLLAQLVREAGKDIKIMVGSGVSEENISTLVQNTKAVAYHASMRTPTESNMKYRKNDVFMNSTPEISEYMKYFSNSKRIKNLINIIENTESWK